MEKLTLSKATLGRLPDYLQFLKELETSGVPYVSATTIAKNLSLGEVQVRKDLNAASGAGKPKVGYSTVDLIQTLEERLGRDNLTEAILVGAGKLGCALLDYDGFTEYGVRIAAAFDIRPEAVRQGSEKEILPMEAFDSYVRDNNIQIGIITVGAASAQQVCDQMLASGIPAIWNFAPCDLVVPKGVLLKKENLALSLAYLSSQLVTKF